MSTTTLPDERELQQLEQKFDSEMRFRPLGTAATTLVGGLLIALSLFHYYTAGFGLLQEITHRGVHLAFVLGLIFLVFPHRKALLERALPSRPLSPGGLPWFDWVLALAVAASVLYIPWIFDDLMFRVGNPLPLDVVMGTVLIVALLEATRRSMGWPLPVIALVFIGYALWGPYFPGLLKHAGASWNQLISHQYLTSQGIYGVAVGVVATYVFHFVLFGVLATRIGLGQLFLDVASAVAGRYAGGPAKVSVVSSGLFGMISGSAIANTVTTGVMTIPLMKKVGFSPRFAGAVEASASCGGQVTPPIMGAAAFIMAETLGIPYSQLILVAIVPAALHYFAILWMVHLEARRLKLAGMDPAEIPTLGLVLKSSWHLFIPLVVMVTLLLLQYTPFMAAFWGITLTIACSWIPRLLGPLGRHMTGLPVTPRALVQGFEMGAKSALGIGAACACVGFVLGITTLTGMGFKFSAFVLDLSGVVAQWVDGFDVLGWFELKQVTILFGLLFTALACIIMGSGVPTTPTYIILASIVAPALAQLGVPQLATHFFVFYYGVLADVTPPVALAAFAAAGIARSEPMRTGMTAFRLSMGKALVPFAFVYAPVLLLLDFNLVNFAFALAGAVIAILGLGAAYTGYCGRPIRTPAFLLLNLLTLSLVFGHPVVTLVGGAAVLAILAWHARPGGREADGGGSPR